MHKYVSWINCMNLLSISYPLLGAFSPLQECNDIQCWGGPERSKGYSTEKIEKSWDTAVHRYTNSHPMRDHQNWPFKQIHFKQVHIHSVVDALLFFILNLWFDMNERPQEPIKSSFQSAGKLSWNSRLWWAGLRCCRCFLEIFKALQWIANDKRACKIWPKLKITTICVRWRLRGRWHFKCSICAHLQPNLHTHTC